MLVDVAGLAQRLDRALEPVVLVQRALGEPDVDLDAHARRASRRSVSSIFSTPTCCSSSADIVGGARDRLGDLVDVLALVAVLGNVDSPRARAAIDAPKRSTCVPKSFE